MTEGLQMLRDIEVVHVAASNEDSPVRMAAPSLGCVDMIFLNVETAKTSRD